MKTLPFRMKSFLKSLVRGIAMLVVFPWALLSGFGRIPEVFEFFAQALAQVPGLPGSYLRVAYYVLTLQHCAPTAYIGVGSFFAHPQTSVGHRVVIGAYCVIGYVSIGEYTHLATGVQVISGNRQHMRDAEGRLTDVGQQFEEVKIGAKCWIGAGAIVMRDVGEGATVAAGSVVMTPVPAGATVGGNPASSYPRRFASADTAKAKPAQSAPASEAK
jgi:acetyltransferase-like isoleucine patch superfamily enzyme